MIRAYEKSTFCRLLFATQAFHLKNLHRGKEGSARQGIFYQERVFLTDIGFICIFVRLVMKFI